jgi:hypothetical protein
VILCVAVSSFVSISAIGWSLMLPLRFSILVLLSVVPISHILIGVYLSSTLMTADFCAAPMNSTMSLFNNNSAVSYFMACQPNVSSPFNEPTAYVAENLNTSIHLQQQLEKYAMEHGAVGQRMKKDFLDPIGSSLQHIEKLLDQFDTVQNCSEISHARQKAEDAVCVYGILGLFSMWVHQILLCLLLFVGVVSTVLVYERVLERELRLDMRYQLLSSYEEDDMEHIYLTPE